MAQFVLNLTVEAMHTVWFYVLIFFFSMFEAVVKGTCVCMFSILCYIKKKVV